MKATNCVLCLKMSAECRERNGRDVEMCHSGQRREKEAGEEEDAEISEFEVTINIRKKII